MKYRVWLVCVAAAALAAAGEKGPMEEVQTSTDKLLDILRDPALKAPERREERREKVCAAIDERFNWPDIAQRTLARHWAPRTPDERQEFTNLFRDLLRRSYLSKIESYSGEKLHYKGARIEGDYARVEVVLVTTRNVDVPIEYSVKKYDGVGWQVYDIAIEGVKLVNNYRTQFASMLNSMSYPKFLEKLKAKVAETKGD